MLWFANIQYRLLTEPDEGRYAEIPREMLASGDWVTPRLNDLVYFEKPPLQYWATALSYRLFGVSAWTSRLYTTTLGFAGILLMYGIGRRLWDPRVGESAALILLGSLMWVVIGHVNVLDMGLTFWLTAAIGCFLIAQSAPRLAKRQREWMLGSWAMIALAVLSKGPVALVLPAFAMVVYCLVERDFGLWKRLHPMAGLVILLAVCAPWFMAVSVRNPGFANFFFVQEHIARYLTPISHRPGPWWYYLPLLMAGTLPWTGAIFRGVFSSWREESGHAGFRPGRFLTVWVACVLVFFSVSHSKLAPYILPVFPALAMLGARSLADPGDRQSMRRLLVGGVLASLLSGLGALALSVPLNDKVARYAAIAPWLAAAAAAMALGVFISWWLSRRGSGHVAITVYAIAALLWCQLLVTGHNALAPERSGYFIAAAMKPHLTPDTRLYSVGQYLQTVPFYLQRTVTLAYYRQELEFGMIAEPQKALPTLDAFARAWRQPGAAIAMIHSPLYGRLVEEGLPMEVIMSDTDTVVVTKP